MNTVELIDSFSEFARKKNIDRPTMIRILEDVFRTMVRKKYGDDSNFNIIINVDKGDLEILRSRTIVSNDTLIENLNTTISLRDAHKIDSSFEIGEEVAEDIKLDEFGRRLVQTARQTLIQKVKDLEKDLLFNKYKDMVGELITCEIYQVFGREIILIDTEMNEISLPKSEQIPKDRFRKGEMGKAVISRVELINGSPKIIASRTSPDFLAKLFESEVPEIYDGLITIKAIVREPGEKAKVAVESYDDRIDPVGACVGVKGSRIHPIVRECQQENIDVINYTENLDLFIIRAMTPAKVNSVKINSETKRASVTLNRDQVSLAIGRGGINIRLASRLTGYEIDVFREHLEFEDDDEDVELNEFSDAIDQWILDEFKRIGLDTAKSVLAISKEDLIRRTDLEDDTIEFVLEILKKEFED
jgi:N utilization substance protein A